MAKIIDNPVESMRLDIEFADNGIILRNPDCEDDVTLAMTTENNAEEYRAIGKTIYNWLVVEAVPEHADHWLSTGAKLNIKAELTGRKRK